MRALLLAVGSLVAGCSGGNCLLDTDCPDLTQICVDSQCVRAGEPRDAGPIMDSGARDSGPRDSGPRDSGAPDANLPCPDVTGSWSISSITLGCNTAMSGYGVTIAAGAAMCDFTATSTSSAALDGTFTLIQDGSGTGTLGGGGAAAEPSCTLSMIGDVLAVACPSCQMGLMRL